MNTAEKPRRWKKFISQLDLQSMVWPGIIFVFIFSYIPMYGVVMAFQQYDIFGGIMKSLGWIYAFQNVLRGAGVLECDAKYPCD